LAADQLNFNLFTYTDNDSVVWNKRGEDNSVLTAVNGATAFGAHPTWPAQSRRFRARAVIYRDGTTFRTKRVVFYTAAAYAAITPGTSTIALHVPGNTATVTYTALQKIDEKKPSVGGARQLGEHA
jgi:hypothetical protein